MHYATQIHYITPWFTGLSSSMDSRVMALLVNLHHSISLPPRSSKCHHRQSIKALADGPLLTLVNNPLIGAFRIAYSHSHHSMGFNQSQPYNLAIIVMMLVLMTVPTDVSFKVFGLFIKCSHLCQCESTPPTLLMLIPGFDLITLIAYSITNFVRFINFELYVLWPVYVNLVSTDLHWQKSVHHCALRSR